MEQQQPKDFADVRVAVVGDLMLDVYTHGTVDRLSPEAPIPILKQRSTKSELGGAGNVVRNVVALGAECHVLGVIGDDEIGNALRFRLNETVGNRTGLALVPDLTTIIKHRFVANGTHQLLRVDSEGLRIGLGNSRALRYLDDVKPDVVVISDYDKGTIHPQLSAEIIDRKTWKVVVDSKSRDWRQFAGATLMTPNLQELIEHSGPMTGTLDDYVRTSASHMIRGPLKIGSVAVTLGEKGIWLQVDAGLGVPITGHKVAVADITGAGDTVSAAMAVALGAGMNTIAAAEFANALAACGVTRPMTSIPTPADIKQGKMWLWKKKTFSVHQPESQPASSPVTTAKTESSDS